MAKKTTKKATPKSDFIDYVSDLTGITRCALLRALIDDPSSQVALLNAICGSKDDHFFAICNQLLPAMLHRIYERLPYPEQED